MNTFPRSEKLKSRKVIGSLFQKGNSNTFNTYPVRWVWTSASEQAAPLQAAFSVSKKTFKRAHDRNLVKRRMREAYRLNKSIILEKIPAEKQFAVMFIYNGKEELSYDVILKAFQSGVKRWIKTVLR